MTFALANYANFGQAQERALILGAGQADPHFFHRGRRRSERANVLKSVQHSPSMPLLCDSSLGRSRGGNVDEFFGRQEDIDAAARASGECYKAAKAALSSLSHTLLSIGVQKLRRNCVTVKPIFPPRWNIDAKAMHMGGKRENVTF